MCLMSPMEQKDTTITVQQGVTGEVLAVVTLKLTDLVSTLRKEVCAQVSGRGWFKFVHDCTILKDSTTLLEAGLYDGATVLLVRTPLRCVTASYDGTARVWCVETGECVQTLTSGESDQVRCALPSPDGKTILTWSLSGTGILWDAKSGEVMCELEGDDDCFVSGEILPEFSQDGRFIVGALEDGMARVWDAESGEVVQTFTAHDDDVRSTTFSQDGERVLLASLDGKVSIWSVNTGKQVASLEGHTDWVESAAFSPDGSRVVTASKDTTAKVWDVSTGACLHTLRGHHKAVDTAKFSPDGEHVLTTGADGAARLWKSADGAAVKAVNINSQVVNCACFSPDGSQILVASGNEFVLSPCSKAGKTEGATAHHFLGHDDWVRSASFSPDGMYIASASYDGTSRIWSTSTGECLQRLSGHARNVETAQIWAA